MRLVVDTKVLISALLAERSLRAHLMELWREGQFDLLILAVGSHGQGGTRSAGCTSIVLEFFGGIGCSNRSGTGFRSFA